MRLDDELAARIANSTDKRVSVKMKNPHIRINNWLSAHGGLQNKRVLDFGCGVGLTACSVALFHEPALVLGVDIGREYRNCGSIVAAELGLKELPRQLRFETILPGAPISESDFDVVYSWSVFEHINQEIFDDVVRGIREKMRPGGYFFMQVAPLFFSAEGSHLWEAGLTKWEHLSYQLDTLRSTVLAAPNLAADHRQRLWGMYERLNRLTADQMERRFQACGFRLMRAQRDAIAYQPPADLLDVYRLDVLTTYQIVLLLQKTE